MDEFEKIANEAIAEAEAISCPLWEYCDGLKAMISVLQDRYEQVKDDLDRVERGR